MPDTDTLLMLADVDKVYQASSLRTQALHTIDLTVRTGEFVAIMGPSGCGKTTLLNILGLIDRPSAGRYEFMGSDVSRLRESGLSDLRKQHIGFIFQNFNLIDELTVAENIELALLYRKLNAKTRRQRVLEAMDQVALAHRADHYPSELSGGQQQRVAIARALVGGQSLILADEPTGNLDSAQGREVMAMLQHLNRQGSTVVMVTHSALHADYANRIVHLYDGALVTDSTRLSIPALG
ncbi:ABC transporter ATP-binding protein [Simiduia litorea]|uniref:ABC transporter ATP-binding protein n=1 Tax=Simiduia litorea TaxID=1435348 RepID=UPI0036F1BD25